MKILDNDFIVINKLDEQTVLVEAKYGVDINSEKSQLANKVIEDNMPSHYGMILNRKAEYSIVPIDAYKVLNKIDNLKAIAIVMHNHPIGLPVKTEQKLFKGKLDVFASIEEAHSWLNSIL